MGASGHPKSGQRKDGAWKNRVMSVAITIQDLSILHALCRMM
jgi:hypothetical protein